MKIAVFLAPGFEEIEAFTVVDYLRRAGQDVITVSVPSQSSTEITSVVEGAHGISVFADQILRDFEESLGNSLLDAIYFPGGMPGASNLAACSYLVSLVQKMSENKKIVAAMCASPAVVLPQTGILAERKWTCYPGMNEKISDGTHIADVPFVFDKNLLTGRGPGTAEQFAMEFVRIVAGEEVAQKIKIGSCQR